MSTAMIWQTVSTSSADTERLGQLLGQQLKSPELVELRADLGGGKTTFVRGLAKGLGSDDTVTSPTFTLSKIYKTSGGQEIHHYDFYRLNEPGIMSDELAESLSDKNVITVVEWSDIVKDVLPQQRLSVEFKMMADDSDERQIIFSYPETLSRAIQRVETDWTEVQP